MTSRSRCTHPNPLLLRTPHLPQQRQELAPSRSHEDLPQTTLHTMAAGVSASAMCPASPLGPKIIVAKDGTIIVRRTSAAVMQQDPVCCVSTPVHLDSCAGVCVRVGACTGYVRTCTRTNVVRQGLVCGVPNPVQLDALLVPSTTRPRLLPPGTPTNNRSLA